MFDTQNDVLFYSLGTRNEGAFDPWMLLSSIKRKALQFGVQYVKGEVVGFGCETHSDESNPTHLKVHVFL